jgi:hypothetical protein
MRDYWSIILIILLSPLLLYAVWFILPTHDDWAATTTPDFTPFFTKEHFFFYGYHWRPFDTWIGYLVGRNPQLLFPAINHLLVVLGHFLSVVALFKVLIVLGFNKKTINVSTLFFFIIPATMATVTAIDSQNQVYALTTDLIAFLFYVKNSKNKYIFWPILIFLATLFKENGLMWALICPVLTYGFDLIDKKTLKKDLLVGLGIMIAYALIIAIQPKDITIHPEYEPGVLKIIKNIVKFLFSSFITVDYIYLLHQPSRKLLWAIVSFLFALPFLYIVFIRQWHLFSHKKMWCTAICLLMAVLPHLLTTFSMMHTYAGLAFITIMIAYSINTYKEQQKTLILSFVLFLIVSVAIDIHLIDSSIKSGRIGNQMAREAIQKTGKPMKSVYLIIIEDDYPKLSSFCVIPNEAFGWGWATQYETNYQWPKNIQDTTLVRTPDAVEKAYSLGRKRLKNWDCIWIINHQQINVINK